MMYPTTSSTLCRVLDFVDVVVALFFEDLERTVPDGQ